MCNVKFEIDSYTDRVALEKVIANLGLPMTIEMSQSSPTRIQYNFTVGVPEEWVESKHECKCKGKYDENNK